MRARHAVPLLAAVVVGLGIGAARTEAGIADSPLPQFADGKASVLVFARSGVVKRGRLQTDVICTSHDPAPVDIGAEFFDADGRLLNHVDAGTGARLDVLPGETVTFGTSGTAAFLESLVLPITQVAQGSVRVVASSSRVECVGFVLDDKSSPPVAMGELAPGTHPAPGPVIEGVALPRFPDGTQATHALVFPGVIKRVRMETNIFCTSLAASPVRVGVELFAADGTPTNDVASGNGVALNVTSGETITFSTTGTAAFLETTVIETAGIAQGLARVVSDSGDILCSAGIVDSDLAPPTSMSVLLGTNLLDQASPSATQTATLVGTPTPTFGCSGDCDQDGSVTVDELVRGINIALGTLSRDSCPSFDSDGGGTVTVDEIVRAVVAALNSCVADSASDVGAIP